MTRDNLLEYVHSLAPEIQKIFTIADDFAKEASDTLSNDFQIAASILSVFDSHAEDGGYVALNASYRNFEKRIEEEMAMSHYTEGERCLLRKVLKWFREAKGGV